MDANTAGGGEFIFGPFRLDATRRRLWRGAEAIPLAAKQFEALMYLVANAGRVVSKDELLAAVWPGRIMEEGSLTQMIFMLRRALRPADGAAYIVTVSGAGYRFAAAVTHCPDGLPLSQAGLSPAAAPSRPPAPPRHWLRGASIAAAVLAAMLPASAWLARLPPAGHPAPFAPPPHSVAVLAFTNLSGDPKQDYFSDGLAEELIDALGRVGTISVAARASAFSFKGTPATTDEIAHRLNVGAIVEGAVRRDNARLRVTVHLIDAITGFQIWSRGYDREAGEVLALQSDIATAVAGALKVTLLAGDASRLTAGGTADEAAFEAYLRGARLMQTLTRADAHAALAAFDEAINADPLYANAHAGRAAALMELTSYWDGNTDLLKADLDRALAASGRAVALAPGSPYAHAVRGTALMRTADFAQAVEEHILAHRLGPDDVMALRGYAITQCMLGHRAESETASRHMLELDPLRPASYHDRAVIQEFNRDYDGALKTIRQEQALGGDDPPFTRAYMSWVHLDQNRPDLAAEDCKNGCAWPEFGGALIAHKLGRMAEAEANLEKLHAVHRALKESPSPDDAEIYAQWGDSAKALAALRKAVSEDPYEGRLIRVLPLLDPIRGTREFAAIEASLHLPP